MREPRARLAELAKAGIDVTDEDLEAIRAVARAKADRLKGVMARVGPVVESVVPEPVERQRYVAGKLLKKILRGPDGWALTEVPTDVDESLRQLAARESATWEMLRRLDGK